MVAWKEQNPIVKLKSPCYKCTERRVGCHSKCDKYRIYRDKYDELNKKEFIAKMYGHAADKQNVSRFNKTKSKKQR